MEQFISDAKRLVHRLHSHDSSADVLISEATELQNKLIAMRHYRDEVNKMNEIANHRPRSTLILGSQLENQRIQTLEAENRELSVSLAEHQSALEMIMNKYREQVLSMMKSNENNDIMSNASQSGSANEDKMIHQISEMAFVMKQSVIMDDQSAMKELSLFRQLEIENENLRELLNISGQNPPSTSCTDELNEIYKTYNVNFKDKIENDYEKKNNNLFHNKDSGIYSNGDLPISGSNKFRVYDSLENLYEKVTNDDNKSNQVNDFSVEDDEPSENCFRAIITDIKLLVEDNNKEKLEKPEIGDNISNPSDKHNATENQDKLVKQELNSSSNGELTRTSHSTIHDDNSSNDSNNIESESLKMLDPVLEENNTAEEESLHMLDSVLEDNDNADNVERDTGNPVAVESSLTLNADLKKHDAAIDDTLGMLDSVLNEHDTEEVESLQILDSVLNEHDTEGDSLDMLDSVLNEYDTEEVESLQILDSVLEEHDIENDSDLVSSNELSESNIKKLLINKNENNLGDITIKNSTDCLVNGNLDESDCESEKTVIDENDDDVDDVLACFDSVINEQMNFDD